MISDALILIVEAMLVYCLVLWTHSLRHRYGPIHFYALIGCITAIMSWLTDAGATVQVAGMTFVVASTVFYTAILLGVFVVYVFDGPRVTRKTISVVIGVSILTPALAAILHFQTGIIQNLSVGVVPVPSLRINAASVVTTFVDLIFLAMAWEFMGKPNFNIRLWLRAFLTLLGVMWLDVLLFSTGAFAGTPAYLGIIEGALVNRAIISIFALCFLYVYMSRQNKKDGVEIENRPVLAIFQQVAAIEHELSLAQQEVERRKKVERELEQVIGSLQKALAEVKTLQGLLPICAFCKKVRDDQGYWNQIETYITERSDASFSHGVCPDCAKKHYPGYDISNK